MSRSSTSNLLTSLRCETRISRSCFLHRPFPPQIRISTATRFSVVPNRPSPSRRYASPFPTAYRGTLLRPLNFLVVLIPIFTFSLGIWQIRRLRWKVALIDEIERNLARDPMVLPANIKSVHLPFEAIMVLMRVVSTHYPTSHSAESYSKEPPNSLQSSLVQ